MSELAVKIYYEDTDCGGVVYHANYLRYFERARTEFFAERGISIRDFMEQGIVFVVARAELNYYSPARYGDTLLIHSEIVDARKVSFSFTHVVRRKNDEEILVQATIKLGCINGARKPTKIPAMVLEAMGREGRGRDA